MAKRVLTTTVISLTLLLLYGCETMQEKQSYSMIPQNRPAAWELTPVQGVTR